MMDRQALIHNYKQLYQPESRFVQLMNDLLVEKLVVPNLAGRRFAELGVSTGIFSVRIATQADFMLLVDCNQDYCDLVAERLDTMGVANQSRCAFFQDLDYASLTGVTDVFLISMIHVLPGYWQELLRTLLRHLDPGARVHATMNNALSCNRLIGLKMGMIASDTAPDAVGQALNFSYVEAKDFLREATEMGYRTVEAKGFLCRPLPIAAFAGVIDRPGMELLWWMGEQLPMEYCNGSYFCLEA